MFQILSDCAKLVAEINEDNKAAGSNIVSRKPTAIEDNSSPNAHQPLAFPVWTHLLKELFAKCVSLMGKKCAAVAGNSIQLHHRHWAVLRETNTQLSNENRG